MTQERKDRVKQTQPSCERRDCSDVGTKGPSEASVIRCGLNQWLTPFGPRWMGLGVIGCRADDWCAPPLG